MTERRKMAESSLFAQRLHAITERRRLQERILATRRELEEERLRVQRLKRKSLRERWLMEGTSMPADDKEHMSSLWEAESHVQDLEQNLSSLQSQMQHLDNLDLPEGWQQQSLKEVKPLDGIVKIDGTSSSSPEKGNTTETKVELASVSPQKPMEATAKEQLENGDMSGDGISGNECSSEKTGVKVNPVTIEGGNFPPYQGRIEAAPTTKNLDPSEAPAAHQRKLAVEKMVIRDHLGQEVGSMDAVGQTQNFIRKEDELEDHDNMGNDCEEWSTSGSLCNVVDQKKTGCATENHLDCDLDSRDGPEGASPTCHDQQNPSNLLQDSANCLDSPRKQGDSEQEIGFLVKEAVLMETGQKELSEQNAEEAEPARNLAVCDIATEEAVNQANLTQKEEMQECHESDTVMLGGAGEGEETKQSVSDQISPGQETTILNPLEEAKLDPDQTSSLKETEETLAGKTSPFLMEETPALLDQAPTTNKDQGPIPQETTVLDALPTVNQVSAQPLLDAAVNSKNQELKEDRDSNLASEAETTEIQENIAAEQQPLLNELKTAVTPQDISLDQQQSKSGIQKHQGASVQEAPIYITTDGNPGSCHLQPAASHQEEGQEQGQNRRKQKTCQCCLVM
ncbi:paralemmin-3 [Crotalus adamanteus]|uniref:Paralemmin-3 n=1 Tax=Crotalus adamanteus TaxID=8729 RepID=A0AAW1BZD4_CROAD